MRHRSSDYARVSPDIEDSGNCNDHEGGVENISLVSLMNLETLAVHSSNETIQNSHENTVAPGNSESQTYSERKPSSNATRTRSDLDAPGAQMAFCPCTYSFALITLHYCFNFVLVQQDESWPRTRRWNGGPAIRMEVSTDSDCCSV